MFTFDPAKSLSNRDKHGIDFVAVQALWLDDRMLVIPVRRDGMDEPRWLAVARIDAKHWSVVFTRRDETVRIISARRARKEEVALYEDEGF